MSVVDVVVGMRDGKHHGDDCSDDLVTSEDRDLTRWLDKKESRHKAQDNVDHMTIWKRVIKWVIKSDMLKRD